MAAIEVTYEVNDAAINFLGSRLETLAFDEIARTLTILLFDLERHIKEVTYPRSGLHIRSGDLQRSIRAQPVERTARSVVGRVIAGQGLAYARIQEYGGTITAKNTEFLAIPLDAAKTDAGVARFAPRQAEGEGYKTFVAKSIIFGRRPGEDAVPLFLLRRSVKIPARPYMRPAMKDFQPRILRDIARAVNLVASRIPR